MSSLSNSAVRLLIVGVPRKRLGQLVHTHDQTCQGLFRSVLHFSQRRDLGVGVRMRFLSLNLGICQRGELLISFTEQAVMLVRPFIVPPEHVCQEFCVLTHICAELF